MFICSIFPIFAVQYDYFMAVNLLIKKDEDRVLFCSSKFWGNPDMPENMQFPMLKVSEDGETYDYPLTFIAQLNCEDIAKYDRDNLLPHEGMLYFFAAIDECLGYEAPYRTIVGQWQKGYVMVKYAKEINFETFQTCILEGETGEELSEGEMAVEMSEAAEDCMSGIRLLADSPSDEYAEDYVCLLQIDDPGIMKVPGACFSILIKRSDLHFGNWKKAVAYLSLR